jgi:hypothetical protein
MGDEDVSGFNVPEPLFDGAAPERRSGICIDGKPRNPVARNMAFSVIIDVEHGIIATLGQY